MKTTIVRCDRCKREVGELIDFSFVNTNIEENTEDKKEESGFYGMLFKDSRKPYPTITGEICYDCMKIIIRWIGHQENSLDPVEQMKV